MVPLVEAGGQKGKGKRCGIHTKGVSHRLRKEEGIKLCAAELQAEEEAPEADADAPKRSPYKLIVLA